MLYVNKITKTYEDITVLKNINMTFEDQGFYIIKGKSGIGKSTILNLILGLEKPDQGEIIYNGKDITKLSHQEKEDFRRNNIGCIFQNYNLIEYLTVRENLLIIKQDKEDEIENILESLGIKAYMNKNISELSGGERQRVAIARTIYQNSPIILADEPTSNLDVETAKEVIEILKSLSKSKLVIMVSHEDSQVINDADGIFKLNQHDEIIIEKKQISKLQNISYDKSTFIKKQKSLKISLLLLKKTIKNNKTLFIKHLSINLILTSLIMIFLTFVFNNVQKVYFDNAYLYGINEISVNDLNSSKSLITSYDIDASISNQDLFYDTSISYLLFDESFEQYTFVYGHEPINSNDIIISDYLAEAFIKNVDYFDFENISDLINQNLEIYFNELEVYKIVGIYESTYLNYLDMDTYYQMSVFNVLKEKLSSIILRANNFEVFYSKINEKELEISFGDDYLYANIYKITNENQTNIIFENFESIEYENNVYITVTYLARLFQKSFSDIFNNPSYYFGLLNKYIRIDTGVFDGMANIVGIFDDSEEDSFITGVFATYELEKYDNSIAYHVNTFTESNAHNDYVIIDSIDSLDNFINVLNTMKIIFIMTLSIFSVILILYNFNYCNYVFEINKKDLILLNKIGFNKKPLNNIINMQNIIQFIVILIFFIIQVFILSKTNTIKINHDFVIIIYHVSINLYLLYLLSVFIIFGCFHIFNRFFLNNKILKDFK